MTVVTTNKKQWRIGTTQMAIARGKTPAQIAAYARVYLIADFALVTDTFALVLESVAAGGPGVNGATFETVSKEIIRFDTSDILAFFAAAGETLPPDPNVYYTPAGLRGNTEDEIVITDGTVLGNL